MKRQITKLNPNQLDKELNIKPVSAFKLDAEKKSFHISENCKNLANEQIYSISNLKNQKFQQNIEQYADNSDSDGSKKDENESDVESRINTEVSIESEKLSQQEALNPQKQSELENIRYRKRTSKMIIWSASMQNNFGDGTMADQSPTKAGLPSDLQSKCSMVIFFLVKKSQ